MTEFRIYYECLEQAEHYIRPMIQQAVDGKDDSIKIVKRPKSQNERSKKRFKVGVLKAIHLLTTPDILITAVRGQREIPLVLIEFTESVSTEDHELQRANSAVAAYFAETFYVKVSSNKKSEGEFGGADYNQYTTPRIFAEEVGYAGYVIAEWDAEKNNARRLQRLEGFYGCPPNIPILRDTIQSAVRGFLDSPDGWYVRALDLLRTLQSYKTFKSKCDAAGTLSDLARSFDMKCAPAHAASLSELLKVWLAREEKLLRRGPCRLDKLRYFVRDDWAGAKINRFSHAMDPDRGILVFISFFLSRRRNIFGIYALVRTKSPTLKTSIENLASLRKRLSQVLDKDKGETGSDSIPTWLRREIERRANGAATMTDVIDISDVWEAHHAEVKGELDNKTLMTLAYFTDGLYLNYNGPRLVWDRFKLLGGNKGDDFHSLLRRRLGFDEPSPVTPIEIETGMVNEDEVTYAMAHRVLMRNGFRIVSISYPGSQGGSAILPERGRGKSQKREYPDIVALPPEKSEAFDALLHESKGKFAKKPVESTVAKLERYLSQAEYREALRISLVVAEMVSDDKELKELLVGVGFGIGSQTRTNWQPGRVHFIFQVIDRHHWSLMIRSQRLRDLIPIIEGDTNFPVCYVITEKPTSQLQLL